MLTLITPTRNRPLAFNLLQTWIERQIFSSKVQWVVVNDGSLQYDYRLNQEVILRKPRPSENHSLCMNLLSGLTHVKGDRVLIIEDDDYLSPTYLQTVNSWLDNAVLVGGSPAIYYNLRFRIVRNMRNTKHASLGQTGFRAELIPWFERLIRRGGITIDMKTWRRCPARKLLRQNSDLQGRIIHVGMKCLPGEKGIGIGHRMQKGMHDPDFSILKRLIGEEPAQHYVALHVTSHSADADAVGRDRCIIESDNCALQESQKSPPVERPGFHVVRSLAADANDRRVLARFVGDSQAVACGESPPSATTNFFFNKNGLPVMINGLFEGSSAFLIAAGPSFNEVPKEPLRRVWSMVLNNASATFRGNAHCSVDDPSRFSLSVWLDPCIMKFVPVGHLERALWDNRYVKENGKWMQAWKPTEIRPRDCPNVIGFCRNERFNASRWLYEDTLNWGDHAKHGGGRSVMLPALRILFLLGFRKVYLLGVDFEMNAVNTYHFSEDRSARAISNNTRTYLRLQQRFSELQPFFLKEDFVVKNCNPSSRLTAFPFISVDDAFEEATSRTGDHVNERTFGMYRSREDKLLDISDHSKPTPHGLT